MHGSGEDAPSCLWHSSSHCHWFPPLFCPWKLSGKENFNERANSSWGEKVGLPKPVACLFAHVSGVTLGCSGGLSVGAASSPQGWLCLGQGHQWTRRCRSEGRCRAVPKWPAEERQGRRDAAQSPAKWHPDGLCYSNSPLCLTYSCTY